MSDRTPHRDSDRVSGPTRARHALSTVLAVWLGIGLLVQILLYHSLPLLSPLTWLHVAAWPLFLLAVLMKWLVVLGVLGAVGGVWLWTRRSRTKA